MNCLSYFGLKNKIYELLRGFNTSKAFTSSVPPNPGVLLIYRQFKEYRNSKDFSLYRRLDFR